jgi:hypothetical protein
MIGRHRKVNGGARSRRPADELLQITRRVLPERQRSGSVQIAAPEPDIREHSVVKLGKTCQLLAMLDGDGDASDNLQQCCLLAHKALLSPEGGGAALGRKRLGMTPGGCGDEPDQAAKEPLRARERKGYFLGLALVFLMMFMAGLAGRPPSLCRFGQKAVKRCANAGMPAGRDRGGLQR